MTISAANNRNDYTGNGATDTYSYTFRILAESHLKVTIRDTDNVETLQVLNTDYTVTGVGAAGGGTIVLTAGNLTTDYEISIRRVLPLTQGTDIRNQGEFLPEIHEDEFDRGVMISQQQQDEIDRSVKLSETYPNIDVELPGPEAGKALMWNALATALINVSPGDVALAIPADDSVDGNKIKDTEVFSFPCTLRLKKGADVASASALPLINDGNYVDVTGTTAITSIDSLGVGTWMILQFDGALTLTHHATDLILPGGVNIPTAAGDHALIVEYAAGDWRCVMYYPADGNPISLSDYLTTAQTVSGAWTFSGAATFSAAPSLQGSAWPSFRVHKNGSNQTIPTGSSTKVTWGTEEFDTNSNFDSATNHRFTPTVAGKYLLSVQLRYTYIGAGKFILVDIWKNGASYAYSVEENDSASSRGGYVNITTIVDANGSTDYFEIFTFHNYGTDAFVDGTSTVTFFSGSRIA